MPFKGRSISRLSELTDVDVTGATDETALGFDSASSIWLPRTAGALKSTVLVDSVTAAGGETELDVEWDSTVYRGAIIVAALTFNAAITASNLSARMKRAGSWITAGEYAYTIRTTGAVTNSNAQTRIALGNAVNSTTSWEIQANVGTALMQSTHLGSFLTGYGAGGLQTGGPVEGVRLYANGATPLVAGSTVLAYGLPI